MKKFVTVLTTVAILGGTAAIAQDYGFHLKARKGVMATQQIAFGVLGAMAKGEAEYDAEAATAALNSVAGTTMVDIAMLFPEGSDAGMIDDTRAKAEIWANLDEFKMLWAAANEVAKTGMATVGDGQEALGPILGQMGQACTACHEKFRAAPG